MIFTVSPHAMLGFKVSYDKKETPLSKSFSYKIYVENGKYLCQKKLNKCNEFIKKEIQDWIINNGFAKYEKNHPPKFLAKLKDKDTITFNSEVLE